ncbi:actin-like ATPase involved in cell division [Desulfitobacterium dichloroeliminans LMG P-21439]|uniref:Actin-like ATPase involved in cell division n=1 Tax=Desulfitobacterium dichloroeliminans (strain LMG P-21439 / DCA1) TaxID=871963 RepID=L0F9B8_DESDL|nr:cell division FtsA domain-containing protein [Desulfitobacterium dichloroeliminans]AGA69513.1 actin-like ATPase involved in cell division [Desulfitobacterium dichloroeliminans LMG P-21439]
MEQVFALDIGTRLVMGLIMEKTSEGYQIIAQAQTEHRQRSMYDGQIHDVEAVAQAVQWVKEELEAKIKRKLSFVSVAAAGRALKTVVATAHKSQLVPIVWEREDVFALEMEAVQHALRELQPDEGTPYHCVGYSTIEAFLEGQSLAKLIGQRGKDVQVKVIATFLPRTVIDGLTGVITRAGLEMRDLTLEPIAAGRAAIPPDMRRMNLALVDVGAGTSDIALTQNGSFFAYGMVPMAGDAITERICQHFLLDFKTGETIKRSLSLNSQITFTDFLGAETTVDKEEIIEEIRPVVFELAQKIAKELLRLNLKNPHAIILVGGGSLTPFLAEILSELLELPRNRVGIQIRERIQGVSGEETLKGPDAITPIGIGISTLEGEGLQYFSVRVNDIPVQVFELQLATVSDALLAAGIEPRLLVGRPGSALIFEFNGEMKILKGEFGKPAQFILNGNEAKLDQELKPGDSIKFLPAVDGKDAQITFADLIPRALAKKIKVNGQKLLFTPRTYCNGHLVEDDMKVVDGAKIEVSANRTIKDLLRFLHEKDYQRTEIRYKIDGQEHTFPGGREIFVNQQKSALERVVQDGDDIVIRVKEITIRDLHLNPRPMVFCVNGEEVHFPPQIHRVLSRGKILTGQDKVEDGMELIVEGYETRPILSDLLPHIKIPQEMPANARLSLKKNGQQAEFTTPLIPGDRIEIHWEKIIPQ